MDFRVLGPVQVVAGSGPVEIASGRQVGLLACLLIARGEIASRDRLIDALWGEQPPASVANALQVLVHALRRRIGAGRIATEGPGYQDSEAEGDEAFRLALGNVVADRPVLRGESTVATIVDDDEEQRRRPTPSLR